MSSQPSQPQENERTVALGQHRIETAIQFWRNGDQLARSQPEPRRQQYEAAVRQVLATLQSVRDVAHLLMAYYAVSAERWQALAQACDIDGGFALNRGVVEDAAFDRRFREIVAASQKTGPFPRG